MPALDQPAISFSFQSASGVQTNSTHMDVGIPSAGTRYAGACTTGNFTHAFAQFSVVRWLSTLITKISGPGTLAQFRIGVQVTAGTTIPFLTTGDETGITWDTDTRFYSSPSEYTHRFVNSVFYQPAFSNQWSTPKAVRIYLDPIDVGSDIYRSLLRVGNAPRVILGTAIPTLAQSLSTAAVVKTTSPIRGLAAAVQSTAAVSLKSLRAISIESYVTTVESHPSTIVRVSHTIAARSGGAIHTDQRLEVLAASLTTASSVIRSRRALTIAAESTAAVSTDRRSRLAAESLLTAATSSAHYTRLPKSIAIAAQSTVARATANTSTRSRTAATLSTAAAIHGTYRVTRRDLACASLSTALVVKRSPTEHLDISRAVARMYATDTITATQPHTAAVPIVATAAILHRSVSPRSHDIASLVEFVPAHHTRRVVSAELLATAEVVASAAPRSLAVDLAVTADVDTSNRVERVADLVVDLDPARQTNSYRFHVAETVADAEVETTPRHANDIEAVTTAETARRNAFGSRVVAIVDAPLSTITHHTEQSTTSIELEPSDEAFVKRGLTAGILAASDTSHSTYHRTYRTLVAATISTPDRPKTLQQFRLQWSAAAASLPVLHRTLIVVQLKMASRVQSPEVNVTLESTGERIPSMIRHERTADNNRCKLILQPYRSHTPSDLLVDYLDYA